MDKSPKIQDSGGIDKHILDNPFGRGENYSILLTIPLYFSSSISHPFSSIPSNSSKLEFRVHHILAFASPINRERAAKATFPNKYILQIGCFQPHPHSHQYTTSDWPIESNNMKGGQLKRFPRRRFIQSFSLHCRPSPKWVTSNNKKTRIQSDWIQRAKNEVNAQKTTEERAALHSNRLNIHPHTQTIRYDSVWLALECVSKYQMLRSSSSSFLRFFSFAFFLMCLRTQETAPLA